MTRIALFPGSFDPLTNGHVDVLKAALALADKVVVAIGVHAGKAPLFGFEDRKALVWAVEHSLEAKDRLSVISFSGLVIDAAREVGATLLVRGLRDGKDFNYEMELAGMNGVMAPELQTVLIPASPESRSISGTLVRQIALMGGDVTPFVPKHVAAALREVAGGGDYD